MRFTEAKLADCGREMTSSHSGMQATHTGQGTHAMFPRMQIQRKMGISSGQPSFAVRKPCLICGGVHQLISGRSVPLFVESHPLLSLRLTFFVKLISLIWGGGWHIFKPNGVSPDDQAYALHVLIQQVRFFGPFPLSYQEIADDERLQICTIVLDHIADNNLGKPFSLVVDEELRVEDREFLCKIMKLDPRDRPTAKELLEDKWLES